MSSFAGAVLIDAVRSPLGCGVPGGSLSAVQPAELLSQVLSSLLDRVGIDPAEVDDVITGYVPRGGEPGAPVGRTAWLAANLPPEVPATTVERTGGASHQAVHFAAQGVMAGVYDVVIAAGVDSNQVRNTPNGAVVDQLARHWRIDRGAMDVYAERSHQRAAAVAAAGEFRREIVPICAPTAHGQTWVSGDETIDRTTVGHSAHAADGAAAILIMSERRAQQLELLPRARFRSFAVTADDPRSMAPGPITATELALKKLAISIDELDHVELDETFAAMPLAWQAVTGVRSEFLNPRGGAIALGHPHAASGIRMMTTMLTALEDTGGRFGMQATWDPNGFANATIIERLSTAEAPTRERI